MASVSRAAGLRRRGRSANCAPIDRLRVLTPRQELPPCAISIQLDPVVARRERIPELGQGAEHGRRARLRSGVRELLDRERSAPTRNSRRVNGLA